jgi:dodecin
VSVYRVTELIGTSSESWEDAATSAIKIAQQTLRDVRVGEVVEHDVVVDDEGAFTFRAKVRLSFKYEQAQ